MIRHIWRRFLQFTGIAVSLSAVVYAIRQVPPHTWSDSMSLVAHMRTQTIGIMAVLEVFVYIMITWSNQWLYRYCKVKLNFFPTLQLQLAADIANRLLPTGGVSGIASWVWLARRLGVSVRRSAVFNGLGMVVGNALVAPIIVTAVLLTNSSSTALRHTTLWLCAAAAAGVLLFALPVGVLLTESGFRFLLSRSMRRSLRAKTSTTVSKRSFSRNIIRFRHDVRSVFRFGVRVWLFPFAGGCAVYILHIAILMTVLNGMHVSITPTQAILAYCITNLVAFTTFLPTTIGVVDLSLTGSLRFLGVPLDVAISATLLYRLITFWLPMPAGIYALLVYFQKRSLPTTR